MPLGSSSATPVMSPGPSLESGCSFRRAQRVRARLFGPVSRTFSSDRFTTVLWPDELQRLESCGIVTELVAPPKMAVGGSDERLGIIGGSSAYGVAST